MPEYLYQIKPTRGNMLVDGLTDQEQEAMTVHFEYLKSLLDAGILIMAGRTQNTDESGFGITIIKVESDEHARDIMNNDPAIARGVVTGQLFPYRVAFISENNARRSRMF